MVADLVDHLFREPPGFKPPGPSPRAETPFWRVRACRRRFPNYFYDNPIALRVKARTAHVPGVSGARLGYLLGAMGVVGVVYAAIVAVVWKIGPYFEPATTFVGRHIY